MKDLSVTVVIPALNEKDAVGPVVRELADLLARSVKSHEVLVVDDGSTDGTADAARAAGATVVRHPVNRGYGQALETGIKTARHDWILMIDADGSYPPGEAAKLLERAPEFDLVIGERTGSHFWGSPTAALLRWTYLRIASFIVGERVPDANSGLRLVRKALAAEKGPVQCLGFSHSTTMTLSFLKAGRFVDFVPIEFRARVGKSHVRRVRDILRTLQLMTQVLIAYNPLKLFVTLAAPPAALGCLFFLVAIILPRNGSPLLAWLLCWLIALVCFCVGCILDAMRMHARR